MNSKDAMYKWLHEGEQEHKDAMNKKKLESEFTNFDYNSLQKMKNKELAAWQAKYPINSPQHIIAGQEWDRRAQEKQKITALQVAFISLAGAIIIAILIIFIPMLLSSHKVENNISIQNQTGNKSTIQGTEKNHGKA